MINSIQFQRVPICPIHSFLLWFIHWFIHRQVQYLSSFLRYFFLFVYLIFTLLLSSCQIANGIKYVAIGLWVYVLLLLYVSEYYAKFATSLMQSHIHIIAGQNLSSPEVNEIQLNITHVNSKGCELHKLYSPIHIPVFCLCMSTISILAYLLACQHYLNVQPW